MKRKPQKLEENSMALTDADIKSVVRKPLSALDTRPEVIMPFDPEIDDNGAEYSALATNR